MLKSIPAPLSALFLAIVLVACSGSPPGGPGVELIPTTTIEFGSKKGTKKEVKIKNTAAVSWSVFSFAIEGSFAIVDKKNCLSKEKNYSPTETCILELEHTSEGAGHSGSFAVVTTLGGSDGVVLKS